MATIFDDDGREIEVVPVEAVAALTGVNSLGGDMLSSAAERIQKAMSAAIEFAYSKGVTDPEKIKELMLLARAREKQKMLTPKEDPNEK